VRRPGFTLFEVTIALTLIVALAAIVLPSLAFQLTDARNEDAQDRFASAVAMARHDARLDGEAIELLARVDESGRLSIIAHSLGESDRVSAEDSDAWISAPKVHAEFEKPFAITTERPLSSDELLLGGEEPVEEDESFELDSTDLPIAVLLPDGSVLQSGPLYIKGRSDVSYEIAIARSTGRVTFSEVADELDEFDALDEDEAFTEPPLRTDFDTGEDE